MRPSPHLVQTVCETPLGAIHLAASPKGLAGLWFHDQRHLPAQLSGPQAWPTQDQHELLREAAAQVRDYFAGQRSHFDLPLDLSRGTAFQQAVWQGLLEVRHGHSSTYGELSRRLGKPQAARAVGAAVGRNPLSIIVPCHRILGQDGGLTGYAGGLPRKTALLQLEGLLL